MQDEDYPPPIGPSNGPNVQSDHAKLIRQVGADSAVLLKNRGELPLAKRKSGSHVIAVIGWDSRGPYWGLTGDHGYLDGTIAQGWGSGTTNFPYLIAVRMLWCHRCGCTCYCFTGTNNCLNAVAYARFRTVRTP